MTMFLEKLIDNSRAISDGKDTYSGRQLIVEADKLSQLIRAKKIHRVGLYADNGMAWIVADLAAQLANVCILPLPRFFSSAQLQHCVKNSGIDALIHDCVSTDDIDIFSQFKLSKGLEKTRVSGVNLELIKLNFATEVLLPRSTGKITYTSGSTGSPKGVCLSHQQTLEVGKVISDAVAIPNPKHLCLLPLSTLLENIAGVYAPLFSNGTVVVPELATMGMTGSSGLQFEKLLAAISEHQPNSLILIPQLLTALVAACEMGWTPPASLQFIAVGGSRVTPQLLSKAKAFGLPVFEGYGLSECCSVVSLNLSNQEMPGTAGKPLPHVSVKIENEEIVIEGNSFLGYVGEASSWGHNKIYTGDIGYIDDEGFTHITGRRKNILISSFGRNISPEWVEAEIASNPMIGQCVVFGDARPYCCALINVRVENIPDAAIQSWIEQVNDQLPDYARIQAWHRLDNVLDVERGLLTENGRPKRDNIYQHYEAEINSLYVQGDTNSSVNFYKKEQKQKEARLC